MKKKYLQNVNPLRYSDLCNWVASYTHKRPHEGLGISMAALKTLCVALVASTEVDQLSCSLIE